MKKLAIKGHPTRGKEIFELMEMMGGYINKKILSAAIIGDVLNPRVYFFDLDSSNNRIVWDYLLGLEHDGRASEMIIFTLEEFLEKYPFKVGDKVYTKSNAEGTIIDIFWDGFEVLYQLSSANVNALGYFHTNELKLYKEEVSMKLNKCTQCVYAVNNNHCGLRGFRSNFNVNYCSAQNTDKLPNGFELQEDGYFSWVNKKPKYPKTFDECLNILYCKSVLRTIIGHKTELLFNLEKLLICRDAYWKIAGKKMGSDGPWEPDYLKDANTIRYAIYNTGDEIVKLDGKLYRNYILCFPTIEMRDAFYENFKDLIEQCKELL